MIFHSVFPFVIYFSPIKIIMVDIEIKKKKKNLYINFQESLYETLYI